MLKYDLFLDDERPPKAITQSNATLWAVNLAQALWYLNRFGPPSWLYLDHDLGGDETAMGYLKALQKLYPADLPGYSVHSQNPVGAENIKAFMESWKKSLT